MWHEISRIQIDFFVRKTFEMHYETRLISKKLQSTFHKDSRANDKSSWILISNEYIWLQALENDSEWKFLSMTIDNLSNLETKCY
jgi:hypothetical protein